MTDPVSTREKGEWRKKQKIQWVWGDFHVTELGILEKKLSNNIITLKCTKVTKVAKEINTQMHIYIYIYMRAFVSSNSS